MSHEPLPQSPGASPLPRTATLVGDGERDLVCDQLSLHFGAGRLTHEELDVRTLAALQARSRAELGMCLSGLPVPQLAATAPAAAAPRPRTAAQGAADMLVALLSGAALLCLLLVFLASASAMTDQDVLVGLVLGSFGGGTAAAGITHLLHARRG